MTNPIENPQQEMETAIARALEQRREQTVPADFAARVMQSLPPQPPARPMVQAGRTAAVVGAVVLAIALFALAPHAQPSFASFSFDLELVVLAQLGGIAYWLAARREV